ncbi:hypothetical protein M6B38_372095 [Iris pallida]|uniref:Secreted protein n=1 Tax=Iris pallida TaxID=29817 RepID=A0AAX6GCP7_IRIPA|nr:hypothetical protein M6B38_372095 [Iris pallida]
MGSFPSLFPVIFSVYIHITHSPHAHTHSSLTLTVFTVYTHTHKHSLSHPHGSSHLHTHSCFPTLSICKCMIMSIYQFK